MNDFVFVDDYGAVVDVDHDLFGFNAGCDEFRDGVINFSRHRAFGFRSFGLRPVLQQAHLRAREHNRNQLAFLFGLEYLTGFAAGSFTVGADSFNSTLVAS